MICNYLGTGIICLPIWIVITNDEGLKWYYTILSMNDLVNYIKWMKVVNDDSKAFNMIKIVSIYIEVFSQI